MPFWQVFETTKVKLLIFHALVIFYAKSNVTWHYLRVFTSARVIKTLAHTRIYPWKQKCISPINSNTAESKQLIFLQRPIFVATGMPVKSDDMGTSATATTVQAIMRRYNSFNVWHINCQIVLVGSRQMPNQSFLINTAIYIHTLHNLSIVFGIHSIHQHFDSA